MRAARGLDELPEVFSQLVNAAAGRAGDGYHSAGIGGGERGKRRVGREQIALAEDDDVGLGVERLAVRLDLPAERVVGGLGIGRVERNHEGEHAGALDVLEKLEAESPALVGALD